MARKPRQSSSAGNKRVAPNELDDAVLKFGQESVRVRSGETTKEITRNEAVFAKTFDSATKGSPHAQRHYLDRVNAAVEKRQKQVADDITSWTAHITRSRKRLEMARENSEPEPEILPHPDDIELDPRKGVRFRGPVDRAELEQIRNLALQRDALLYQYALERRLDKCRKPPEFCKGDAYSLAVLYNGLIPKRFRLSDNEFIDRNMRYRGISKRELLKKTRAAWVACGLHDVKRGARLLPPDKMMVVLDAFKQILKELHASNYDPGQIDQIANNAQTRIFEGLGIAQG